MTRYLFGGFSARLPLVLLPCAIALHACGEPNDASHGDPGTPRIERDAAVSDAGGASGGGGAASSDAGAPGQRGPHADAGGGGAAGTMMDAGNAGTSPGPRDAATDDGGESGGTAGAGDDAGSEDDEDGGARDRDAGGHGEAGLHCSAPVPASSPARACPSMSPVPLKLTTVVNSGPGVAVLVTHAPNDPHERLFIVYQSGQILIVENGAVRPTPFLDLGASVSTSGEQGLFGLAFDPDYEVTGRFWVNYTARSAEGSRTVVESYRASAEDADVADPSTRTPLLEFGAGQIHNAGMLAFGPDDCLYIATGDIGDFGTQNSTQCMHGNGQCLETELGKVLRIDVDHPADGAPGNLDVGGFPHIWDYGLRNPWRFSFDRGDLYIGDVGQSSWEEIDIEPRGTGGRNYGWRITEGKHCLNSAMNDAMCTDDGADFDYADFAAPAHDYARDDGDCVIGGYVYRGASIPSLNGYYLFADFGERRVWALAWDGADLCAAPLDLSAQLQLPYSPASFGEDADGELYIAMEDGSIARIDPQ